MLELKECCKVPFPQKLFEGYDVNENRLSANVNTSKVLDMMKLFIDYHDEPLFFILEIPSKQDVQMTECECLLSANEDIDTYFIDGLDAQNAKDYLDSMGNFLLKDGLNTFGIGCHNTNEEILFGKYNVMTIYASETQRYHDFFSKFSIPRTQPLITAWDTFDIDNPGICTLYKSKESGKTIYDIPQAFKEYGMYLYKNDQYYSQPITYEDLIGKVLLVGMSYFTSDEQLIEQKQFYGVVTEADESIIRFKQNNGDDFTLPPDLSAIERARPGEYKLRSTGEIVVNPDFTAAWKVVQNDDN